MDYYNYETMLEVAEARERINDSLVELDSILKLGPDTEDFKNSVNIVRDTLDFLRP
jgi:hypothetical protein